MMAQLMMAHLIMVELLSISLSPHQAELPPTEAEIRRCEEDIDAATVTGEIIVCRQRGDDQSNYYSGSREDAQKRYAEETAFAGDILAPDVAGDGIFRGAPTVGGLCIIPPCPKDPALIIDVEALPDAEEGSDADRIARGLPPLGEDGDLGRETISEEELGLPPSLDTGVGVPVKPCEAARDLNSSKFPVSISHASEFVST